ncbi:hypothetical protein KP509_32G057400 [Ceratopteris richardii]|nr:hypothetical protein KP509_32G057400 [Ceratopteris richardii]
MFASCNATAPLAQWSGGADVIPLNSSGTFYYICGIPGHCDAGQKVAITVEAAQTGTRHQVGGTPGWSLPSRSNVNYIEWASTQTFLVGDTLYFNYSKDFHNVMEVTKEHYDTCNSSNPILFWDDGATVVQLNTSGTFYFICGVPGHCDAGQKLAVRVAASLPGSVLTGTPSPSPAPSPISASVSLYANAMPAISNIMIILMVFTALAY